MLKTIQKFGWKLELIAYNYGAISSSASKNWSVNVNGESYSGTNTIGIGNNQTKTLASGTTRIYHNSDGTKSFNYSFSQQFDINFNGWIGTKSGSGSATLDTIPRYANITQFDLSSGLESIIVDWGVDCFVDAIKYSLNEGDWIGTGGDPFTISGLAPNTTYGIRISVRRGDSQLWTDSDIKYITTKDIARITSAPDINFGDNTRITKTNPSGTSNQIRIETLNPTTTIVTRTQTSDDMTIVLTDEEWDAFYKKLGNNNSMTIRYVVDTIGNNTYYDYVDKILTLTGNQKSIKIKENNSWKRGKLWLKVGDIWKQAVIWLKVNGTWKRGI